MPASNKEFSKFCLENTEGNFVEWLRNRSSTSWEKMVHHRFTIDVEKISDREFTPACVCNNKGRVIATFWIKSSENGFIISILEELSDLFVDHMKTYIPFFLTTCWNGNLKRPRLRGRIRQSI